MEEARACAVEASRPQRPPMLRTTLLVSSVLAVSLIAAFGMAALALV